jgi:hypothetical protein
VVYNNTTYPLPLELEFIVNGKGSSQLDRRTMQFTGHRCIGPCNEELDESGDIEANFRFWSDPNSWPTGALPVEGEDVHIEPTWNMVLDLPETPKLNLLRVNGRLSFANNTAIHLKAKHVFVRAGELWVGAPTLPHSQA